MKKRKRVPRLWGLVLILCLNIGLLPVSVGAAEADTVLIDVGQGRVTIEPDGYMIGDQGEKVSYTGKYILTGNGSQEVYFMSGSDGQAVYDVILKDMNIQSSEWKSALNIDNGVTLNLTAEGENRSVGYNHPGLQLSHKGSGTVNIKLSPDSSLLLDCKEGSSIKSIAENISAALISDSGDITGAEHLKDRTQALSLSRGTAEPHAWVWEPLDDAAHKAYCSKCSEEKGVFLHVPGSGVEVNAAEVATITDNGVAKTVVGLDNINQVLETVSENAVVTVQRASEGAALEAPAGVTVKNESGTVIKVNGEDLKSGSEVVVKAPESEKPQTDPDNKDKNNGKVEGAKAVQTGDSSNVILWVVLAVAAVAVAAGCVILYIRRRNKK